MSEKLGQAITEAVRVLGAPVLSYPAQFESRDDTVSLPAWALAALVDHAHQSLLHEPAARQEKEEHAHLLESVSQLRPKPRNNESMYFEDYLSAIAGEYHDQPMTRNEALAFVAKKYGKSEQAMLSALKRELKYLRETGETIDAVLPRNPDTRT